jgi:hypothetical protein
LGIPASVHRGAASLNEGFGSVGHSPSAIVSELSGMPGCFPTRTKEPIADRRSHARNRLAEGIVAHSAQRSAKFPARFGVKPCLATVIVGDDPASVIHVNMKQNQCHKAGIDTRHVSLPAATTTEVISAITTLSDDSTVHGILLQHPCPPGVRQGSTTQTWRCRHRCRLQRRQCR